jgi:hypothetical protein
MKTYFNQIFLLLALTSAISSCQQTSESRITNEILQNKNLDELRVIRNEIFARHGYIFKSEDLRQYFSTKNWYKPKFDDVTERLSEGDKANISMIVARENELSNRSQKKVKQINLAKPIELVVYKSDSGNDFQNTAIKKFLEEQRQPIIEDFKNYWSFDIKAKNFYFKIIKKSIWRIGNKNFAIIKLAVNGRSENSSGDAFNNYLLKLEEHKAHMIYETKFFQPECGTPNYNFGVLSSMQLGNQKYSVLTQETEFEPCHCVSKKRSIDWLIFDDEYISFLQKLEKSYSDSHNNTCEDQKPSELRETKHLSKNSKLIAKVTYFEDGKQINTEEKVIKLKYGIALF